MCMQDGTYTSKALILKGFIWLNETKKTSVKPISLRGQTICCQELGNVLNWIAFSLVAQSCPTFCDPMDCSMPDFPVHHQLLELAQTHVHQIADAIQPSYLLLSPSPAFNLSWYQALFQWVYSSPQVEKVLEFSLQHQSFQSIFRTDFL